MPDELSAVIEQVLRPAEHAMDETGEKILAAALAEFLQIGIRPARLEELARRAGVPRATVHRRFIDKDHLVTAVLFRGAYEGLEQARALIAAEQTVPDKVAAGFVFALEYARNGTLSPLLRNDPLQVLPVFTTRGEPLIALLREFFLQVLRETPGDAPPLPGADALARLVVSYCLSPDTSLGLHDPSWAADFARERLAPLLTGPSRLPERTA